MFKIFKLIRVCNNLIYFFVQGVPKQLLIIVKINISLLFATRSRNLLCLVQYKSHVIFHDS